MLHRQKRRQCYTTADQNICSDTRVKMAEVKAEQYSSTTCCGKFLLGRTVIHLYMKIKHTLSIFLFTVFLPHSLLSCSLIACNSLPKWIILSMAAWLPPHSWRLNWLESTSKETISSSSPVTEPRVTTYGSTDSALIHSNTAACPERAGQPQTWPHVLLYHTLGNGS